MSRFLSASVVAALLLASSAWADNDRDHIGRYQLIPDAVHTGKAGKRQEQAILLDSATGKTWILSRGKGSGAVWVPVEVKVPEGAQTANRSDSGGDKANVQKSFEPEPPKTKKKTPRQSIWDYERDP